MRAFVNHLLNYGVTRDTDLNILKHMPRLKDHFPIDVSFNHAWIQPLIVRASRRLTTTRFAEIAKKLPTHTVLVPSWQVESFDIAFHYNITPRYFGRGRIPPSICSTHWQTDRVLNEYGIRDIEAFWKRHAEGEGRYDAYMVSTRFAVPLFKNILKGIVDQVHYCPFFLPHLVPIAAEDFAQKLQSKNVRLLFVGRDGVRKGIKTLMTALASLSGEIANQLEVDIVTETRVEGAPKSLAAFRHHNRITNEESVNLMRQAQIFCLPTLNDVYGVVFIEALSQGCAVIADDDLTRLEMVRDNGAGVCVDPSNAEQLADALTQLISDRHRLAKRMTAAKNVFVKEYSAGVIAKRYQGIFRETIRSGRRK